MYNKFFTQKMKSSFLFKIAILASLCQTCSPAFSQSNDTPLYMGKASTGENVYFYGGRAQCGDLPRKDVCWKNPMIKYTLGKEEFNTVLDCKRRLFSEAYSVTSGKRYIDIKPSSTATKNMVLMACVEAAKQY